MFRGSYTARIDENGRFKLPVAYKRVADEKFGLRSSFFLAVPVEGEALLYPLASWKVLESKVKEVAKDDDDLVRFIRLANRFGAELEMDTQGRLVVPADYRARARLTGDLAVTGMIDYLEIMNREACQRDADEAPLTAEQSQKAKRILGWI